MTPPRYTMGSLFENDTRIVDQSGTPRCPKTSSRLQVAAGLALMVAATTGYAPLQAPIAAIPALTHGALRDTKRGAGNTCLGMVNRP
jgi:hypothetical protein